MLDEHELDKALNFRLSPEFDAWIYFNLVGSNVLLPILIVTFLFAKKVRRHGVLINLCIHFMMAGIFSLIQFYAGQHKLKTVDEGVCVAQAAFLSGMQPMCVLGVAMLLFYMVESSSSVRPYSNWKLFVLLGSPYIVGCIFIITTYVSSATDGSAKSSVVKFGIFYCTLRNGPVSLAIFVTTLVCCGAILVLKVILMIRLYRNWKAQRLQNRTLVIDFQLITRTILFATLIIVGFCTVKAIKFFTSEAIPLYLYTSIVPTLVFLIFGSQPDVLRTWLWMKEPAKVDTPRLSCISAAWRSTRTSLRPPQSPADSRRDQIPNSDLNPPLQRQAKPTLMISIPGPELDITHSGRLVLVNEDYRY
ncbi:hypothetical protein FA15DRAFT_108907 [Coprinopsis marcescibilis]|uniref:G-protein coupled receptors family 1 profile domain-containing protein n=1 Tax=Coprinopsis marcescibilis TaxID=230819 RepID=A0A5C3L5W5_COPMA|nr:hypothetical protein FA15DRAFT_108907 [Coprinopsis marcescibilis]